MCLMDFSIVTVFDCSGSFIEMGKARVNRNIWRTLVQLQQLHSHDDVISRAKIEYYSWNNELRQVFADPVNGVPVLKAAGNADVSLFVEFIRQIDGASKQPLPVLLCTDGAFKHDDLMQLRKSLLEASHIIPMAIAIGIDADLDNLHTLTPFVYAPENILEAVDYAVSFICGIAKCPTVLDEVKIISTDELSSLPLEDDNQEQEFSEYGTQDNLLDRYQMRMMKLE